jgi:hypothetical protein
VGAEPYFYVVDYQEDIQAALDQLREREFQAGRFHPAVHSVEDLYDSPTHMRPGPGAQHESIDAIFEEGNPDGTRSILDLWTIGDRPAVMTASGLTDSELDTYFGTHEPTVEAVNDNDEFWADIERGSGRYVIVDENGRPSGICFAGYSFD